MFILMHVLLRNQEEDAYTSRTNHTPHCATQFFKACFAFLFFSNKCCLVAQCQKLLERNGQNLAGFDPGEERLQN